MTARVALVALVAAAVIAVFWWAVGAGVLRGCVPIAPRELPSGSQPGAGVEGVAAGAKQVVWGSGPDRVEQIVGLSFLSMDSTTLASVAVRGHPATLYRVGDPGSERDLALTSAEDGCDRTVVLPPGTTIEQAIEFAARY